jgi:hypothetical protein
MTWTDSNIEYIKNNYHNTRNEDLANDLNIKINSIITMARKLKLYKSKEHRSKMISKRNRMVGQNHTIESLKESSILYKTKGEFQYNNPSGYSYAKRYNLLDDICKHMIPQSYSIPQLICKYIFDILVGEECEYDTRKIIKPYELDLYYHTKKLAIEYNGKGWHSEDDNTKLKIQMCEKLDITLLVIIENNRRYEEDIKNQIIDNLDIINNVLNKNIKSDDIHNIIVDNSIFDKLLDTESIFKITKKYTDYTLFKKENYKLYQKIYRLNQLDKYTSHMKRQRELWNIDKIKETVSKYEFLYELIDNDQGCYNHIKRNKLEHLIKKLKYKNTKKWNIDKIKETIDKYELLKDFKSNEKGCYSYITTNKLNFLMDILKKKPKKWSTDNEILETVNKYEFLKDLRVHDNGCYTYIKRNKLEHLIKNLKRYGE